MKTNKILITGSSGTIGTRLFERLLEKYDISGADLKPNKWNKSINDRTIISDLRDKNEFDKLPEDIDLVIHLAANARVYNLIKEPSLARDNSEILFNILEFCRKNKITKFIFASSREVYGNIKKDKCSENDASIQNCESPYTASKIQGESFVHAYSRCYGIDFIILRFSNVYGMYDESDRIIPLFIKLTNNNKALTVYGKEKLLDFTYIDDAISGIIKCIENFDNTKNEVFNIASGKGISMLFLANLIQKKMNSKNGIIVKENRKGEILRFVADNSKAKKNLDYNPEIDINEGITRSIDWYEKKVFDNNNE